MKEPDYPDEMPDYETPVVIAQKTVTRRRHARDIGVLKTQSGREIRLKTQDPQRPVAHFYSPSLGTEGLMEVSSQKASWDGSEQPQMSREKFKNGLESQAKQDSHLTSDAINNTKKLRHLGSTVILPMTPSR